MYPAPVTAMAVRVALIAEGVDRNRVRVQHRKIHSSRPHRGGRG